MLNVNEVSIAGVVSRDPFVQVVGQKKKVKFSVAVVKRQRTDDGPKEFTSYVPCVLWMPQAGVVMMTQGTKVYCRGEIRTDMWEKDGKKHYDTHVNCYAVTPLDGGSDDSTQVVPDGEKAYSQDTDASPF